MINLTKGNSSYLTNVNQKTVKNNFNTNNNAMSRSSSTNSKSSINKNKNNKRKRFTQKPTLKNYIFTKSNKVD